MTIRTIVLAMAVLIPISAGAQTAAECVAVYDWNGTRVGRTQDSHTGDAAERSRDG